MDPSSKSSLQASKRNNRFLYLLMIGSALLLALLSSWHMAVSAFALALVFDPFDPTVPFPKRPTRQKALLLAHLGLAAFGIGWMLFQVVS